MRSVSARSVPSTRNSTSTTSSLKHLLNFRGIRKNCRTSIYRIPPRRAALAPALPPPLAGRFPIARLLRYGPFRSPPLAGFQGRSGRVYPVSPARLLYRPTRPERSPLPRSLQARFFRPAARPACPPHRVSLLRILWEQAAPPQHRLRRRRRYHSLQSRALKRDPAP